MAEKLCELRKKGGGGGKYTETVLWTNPSPSVAFAAQTVTLSDSINNYKYVAIYYKYAGTNIGVNDPMPVIVPVDKFKTSLKNNSTRHNILVLGAESNGNSVWARNVFYASDTTIEFDTGYRQNGASNSGDICVPTEILGLNELAHGTKQASSGTIPAVAGQTTKITLGWQPQFVCLTYVSSSNRITVTYEASRSTTKVNRWVKSGSSVTETDQTLPNASTNSRTIISIDSDGFTAGPNDDSTSICNYYAYGVS